jgi:hypothetical protein
MVPPSPRHSLSSFFLVLLILFFLASCAPLVQDGNVRIILGGSGNAHSVVSEGERDDFIYTLDFSGPGGEVHIETSRGQDSVTLMLAPGDWSVHVEAWHNGTFFGSGDARFPVYAGRANTVSVRMEPDFGGGFLSDSDDDDFGPDPAVESMFRVDSLDKWNRAVADIQDGGDNKNYVITLTGDITLSGSTNNTFGSAANIKVSLRGVHTLSLDPGGPQGNLLRVTDNQALILRDLTLQGCTGNNASLVYVYGSGASLTMKAGSTITGNNATFTSGGGVALGPGAFIMKAGSTISGNTATSGGGVFVSIGSFTMEGGVITGNTATGASGGGGVYVTSTGSFSKSGGIIYGSNGGGLKNTAAASGSGHAVYVSSGSGKYRDTTALSGDDIKTSDGTGLFSATSPFDDEDFGPSSFTIETVFTVDNAAEWGTALTAISGGTDKNYVINLTNDFDLGGISGWSFGTASGIKVSLRGAAHDIALSSNGSLLRVNANQTLILRDLTLTGRSGNNASLVVNASGASLHMKAGATISGNTTTGNGGGVSVSGSFIMEGGTISGNTGGIGGGGVYVSGSFTMKGGVICGNTAERGGGVYIISGSSNIDRFIKTGGTIYGSSGTASTINKATYEYGITYGHAVFFYNNTGIAAYYYRDTMLDDTTAGNITTNAPLPSSGAGHGWTKQ